MNKINILAVVGLLVFALSGWSVYAHETDTMMTGSTGMMNMMDLMHEHMDENQALDCDKVGDAEMMEKGEDMMEEMMGHDDHEAMEKVMNEEDHNSLHMMMGIWSSGCVGGENMSTLAKRYGFNQGNNMPTGDQGSSASWPSLSLGVILGGAGVWGVGKLLARKAIAVVGQ